MSQGNKGATRFAGYAAIFDRVDRGGDVVKPGAFARAVAAGPGGVPLLWQHEAGRPIGRIETLAEDERGLRVTGRLSDASEAGREAAALLRDGAVRGAELRLPRARGEAGVRARAARPRSDRGIDRDLSDAAAGAGAGGGGRVILAR